MLNVYLTCAVCSFAELSLISCSILLLEHPHLLNLIEVDHEALIHMMEVLDALAAEDGRVFRAVKVLDTLIVVLTKVRCHCRLEIRIFFICFQISLQTLLKIHV